MSFALDISKFVKKAKGNQSKVVRKIVIDLGTKIIMRTPVGNPSLWEPQSLPAPEGYVGGRARANWQYSNGLLGNSFDTLDTVDASGATSIGKITVEASAAKVDSIHWIGNALPYIERLENGWSKQAPGGMVKLSVQEFPGVVLAAVNSVSK